MNFNTARKNMLLNQVRTWDFVSPETLNIMRKVQREEFVPVEHRKLAFSDMEIPLGHDEFMMRPILEGRILQSLDLTGNESILEAGTGSAYMTALLALSGKKVLSMDIYNEFVDSAKDKLLEAKISNTECIQESIFDFKSSLKFDVIVLTGSLETPPEFLYDTLNDNGKIFAIIGKDPVMSACIITKNNTDYISKPLFETNIKSFSGHNPGTIFTL